MRWTRYWRRKRRDNEVAQEIEAYIAQEIDDNIAAGMSREEARWAATRKFGNTTAVREEVRDMNTIAILETFWLDLRYGARLLRLNPGFATVAILSLGLGIGANAAIFQLMDAIRLRTLPVKNPQELASVRVVSRDWTAGSFSGPHPALTNPLWEQLRDHQQAFSGMLAWGSTGFNIARGGEARFAQGLWVSGGFFNVLGVSPMLGRVFSPADDRRGCGAPGAVISYAFWQRELAGHPSVVGRMLTLDGHPFEIIGVTPASFFGVEVGRTFDVAVPICAEPIFAHEASILDQRHEWWLAGMGRLKPGWSLSQASAHLAAISPVLFEATMPTGFGHDMKDYLALKLGAFPAGSGFSTLREDSSRPMWLLMATTALVLLIACANLANLMLARASAREREISIRLAIGASRGRLIRQLLAESLLLAALGSLLGAFLAGNLSRLLVSLISTQGSSVFVDLSSDWRVFTFTGALAIVTCILFGLTPALQATRTDAGSAMKGSGRGMTASPSKFGLRRLLVVAQVALSLVLLLGALLFTRTLRNLLTLDTGFQQEGILITSLDLNRLNLPKERYLPFKQELIARLVATPGVESAAEASIIPLDGNSWTLGIRIEGAQREQKGGSRFSWVSPGYFRTLGTPLLTGRDFDGRDTFTSPKVVIVNETFARRFLNGANPIGKRYRTVAEPGYPETVYEIVGLVKDTKYQSLRQPFQAISFAPVSQDPAHANRPGAQILVRSNEPLNVLTTAVKRTIGEISPSIVIHFRVFKSMVRDRLVSERVMALLSGFFGFLATLLATIGIYGVMSYTVARRRSEIGIRIALGADRRDVLSMILREAGFMLAIGLVAGTALALAAASAASKLLFGLEPRDPLTLAMAVTSLTAVALAASYWPARRAARLDPMVALRDE
jgi:predicted permease